MKNHFQKGMLQWTMLLQIVLKKFSDGTNIVHMFIKINNKVVWVPVFRSMKISIIPHTCMHCVRFDLLSCINNNAGFNNLFFCRYDNEFGYSCRVVDLVLYMASKN